MLFWKKNSISLGNWWFPCLLLYLLVLQTSLIVSLEGVCRIYRKSYIKIFRRKYTLEIIMSSEEDYQNSKSFKPLATWHCVCVRGWDWAILWLSQLVRNEIESERALNHNLPFGVIVYLFMGFKQVVKLKKKKKNINPVTFSISNMILELWSARRSRIQNSWLASKGQAWI